MSKRLLHIIILSLLVLSCSKETGNEDHHQLWLRFPDTDGAYVARDVIALSDGSVLLGCVGMLEGPFGTAGLSASLTPNPAFLFKYDPRGQLLWKAELPEKIQTLWHHTELKNGEIILVGEPSDNTKPEVSVARINQLGELKALTTIFNQKNFFGQFAGGSQSVDCIELPSGEIALALPSSQASNEPTMPRLVVMDTLFNISYDKYYRPDDVIKRRFCYQMRIKADPDGNIILNGWDTGFNNDTLNYFAYVVKLAAGNYEPIYHQIFHAPSDAAVSPAAISNSGSVIWASTGPEAEDTIYRSSFNLRNQEVFYIGNSIKLWVTNGESSQTIKRQITGFPGFGYINQLKKCSDGGYILLGTCNINQNQNIPSAYQLMIIKLSPSLDKEWMEFLSTGTQVVSGDISETSEGFVISATHLTPGGELRPVIFTINRQGRT